MTLRVKQGVFAMPFGQCKLLGAGHLTDLACNLVQSLGALVWFPLTSKSDPGLSRMGASRASPGDETDETDSTDVQRAIEIETL